MKIFYLLLILFLSSAFSSYAQQYREFYVVQKNGRSIEPSAKTVNADNELTLTFNRQELQNFFQTKKIYIYEKAFPGSQNDTLKNTYFLKTNANITKTALENLTDVLFVEDISNARIEYMHEPNDYFFEIENVKNSSILDLVRAPLAWEITTGDPNVIIGIVDSPVNFQHPELASSIIEHQGNSSVGDSHGTKVASVASGTTSNNTGFASIGYNTRMITNSEGMFDIPQTEENPSGFARIRAMYKLSLIPGIKVLNGSWGDGTCIPNVIDELVFNDIKNRGIFTVFAAGNGNTCGLGPTTPSYPNAYSSVFTVTSVGHLKEYTGQPITPENDEIKDVHLRYNHDNPGKPTHSHYPEVDLSAVGYSNIVANYEDSYMKSWGTSFAAPMVAGAAALMFSVNPDLTPQQVSDILKSTADDIYHIPENQEFQGLLGAGRLNVFRAVKTVQCMNEENPIVDFMIKDSREDVGHEPNTQTQYMWTSDDIYIRNQNDGKLVHIHENPKYDGINPNYVYVRVTNMGCQTTSGNDLVKVNWAKANTSLQYPEYWDGSIVQNGVAFGGDVGTGIIPSLAPGQEALVEIPWMVPSPEDYQGINENPWHFCLLAETLSPDDDLTSLYS